MALNIRALALASALAGTTLFASPAAAATTLPATGLGAAPAAFELSRFDPASATADWRCRGWNCHRRYRRNRVDAGDVLIGAAIIGGIAAIVSSNNRRERERDVVIVDRDRDWDQRDDRRYDDRRLDDRRSDPRGTTASGLDSAADLCLDRIERDVRVDTVDNVERNGAGWRVSGTLFNGSSFQCRIGNNGQIDGIDYGSGFSGASSVPYLGRDEVRPSGQSDAVSEPYLGREENQWSDERYADARRRIGQSGPASAQPSQALPAYPGGPIPGEVIPETVDGEL
jgi:hypothetical protein